jgi:hypothetical protein
MGQRLTVVRTLERELQAQGRVAAARLWSNSKERTVIESVVTERNRWAHHRLGDQEPIALELVAEGIWIALRHLTETKLLLYSSETMGFFVLRGPAGLYSPRPYNPRHTPIEPRPLGEQTQGVLQRLNNASTSELFLELGDGQLLSLAPFLDHQFGAFNEHRVRFLIPTRDAVPEYLDPLGT